MEGIQSCKTRQSILDITRALRVCAGHTSGWVVLVEDDNTLREGAGLVAGEIVDTVGKLEEGCKRTRTISRASRTGTATRSTSTRDQCCLFKHVEQVSTQEYRNSKRFRAVLYAGIGGIEGLRLRPEYALVGHARRMPDVLRLERLALARLLHAIGLVEDLLQVRLRVHLQRL